jgi:hypothetical protein
VLPWLCRTPGPPALRQRIIGICGLLSLVNLTYGRRAEWQFHRTSVALVGFFIAVWVKLVNVAVSPP